MDDKSGNSVRIGKMLLDPEELKFKIQYNGELFTMRYPNPIEKAQIESEIARTLGGMSRDAFNEDHLFLVEATAYVNRLVVPEESPDWFKSAWTCYDEKLIAVLYGEYLSFRAKFRERLEGGGLQGSGERK
jgi:hypothetical protein